jgi:hypothetical protein
MKRLLPLSSLTLVALPILAEAQVNDIFSLGTWFLQLIGKLMQLIWVLTIMSFLWGLVDFIRTANNEKERAAKKKFMVYSVVAFIFAISFWALVTFVIRSVTLSPDQSLPIIDSSGALIK